MVFISTGMSNHIKAFIWGVLVNSRVKNMKCTKTVFENAGFTSDQPALTLNVTILSREVGHHYLVTMNGTSTQRLLRVICTYTCILFCSLTRNNVVQEKCFHKDAELFFPTFELAIESFAHFSTKFELISPDVHST